MTSTAYESFHNSGDGASKLKGPAERALIARIMRYFEDAVHALPNRDKAKALAAPDDFWTVMETLALAPVRESPELRVRLRGAIARRELLEAEGGVLNPSNVAKLLHLSRQAVGQRRAAGKLLGVETPTGYVYPVWQFEGSSTLPGLEEVLEALDDTDPWTQLIFFLTPNDAIGGKKPLALLRQGKLAPVQRAARLHDVQGPV